ncbi:MAG: cytochrome c [Acidobacteriota bacterium]|nr:cytochrome c [Acidobacteriota bacterium]
MKFVLGVVVGILLIPISIYFYFRFGYAPVATAASPIPFEQKLAKMGLHARINAEYPRAIPFQATDNDLQNAAHLYRQHCAICHGVPNNAKTATAKGMYPAPPQLFHGTGVTDDQAGETYWKVANGIRLTGMPAYRGDVSDHDIWSISEMLAGADKLPADVQAILNQTVKEQ